jgi:uroporphyrinogen-III synthase
MTPRVALTTTPDREEALGQSLRQKGLQPVSLPCIEVIAAAASVLESAREAAASCDLIVLTSARVVEVLWPAGDMPPMNVAAVGALTAAAANEAGGLVTFVGSGGGADLATDLVDSLRGRQVAFPHAAGADPATLETLRRAGARVTAQPIYETRPVAPDLDEVEAVVFGSPTAVEGWHLSRTLDDLVVGAVGHTTTEALSRWGAAPHLIPETPSFHRLVDLVAGELADRSRV